METRNDKLKMNTTSRLPIVLYGAGGHAAAVESATLCADDFYVAGLIDDGKQRGVTLVHARVTGGRAELKRFLDDDVRRMHIAVGDNRTREKLFGQMAELGFSMVTVQHPSAVVEVRVSTGEGTFLAAYTVVGTRSRVGRGCIINTAASVDHDCVLGDFVHVCPGVRIAGDVKVGARTMIGIGASIIPEISIGEDCVVGAGAVVIRDVPVGETVAGNPARPLKRKVK